MKLAYIAQSGARAAAEKLYWMGAPKTVPLDYTAAGKAALEEVTWLMLRTGMSTSHLTVTPDFSDTKGVKLSVCLSSLPISIPLLTQITEVAAQPYDLERPPGYCQLNMWSLSGGTAGNSLQGIMYMPCYGAYTLDPNNNPGVTTAKPAVPSDTTVWVAPYVVGQVGPQNPSLQQSPPFQ